MSSSKIVGIDLGTTNSLISIVEGGQPIAIPSAEGDYLFPSVVGFSRSGERLVGSVAKRQAISNPERTIISVKRHMGTDFRFTCDEKSHSPQEISAMILQKVKADAEAYLGFPVEKAVITVPAYFNDSERQATKDAGAIAGLEVVRIINEPTASCLAYGLDKTEKQETVLVWDLGGGTFDVSVLDLGGGVFQVKATAGNNRLGGDDWDQRIMDWLVEEFKKQFQIDLRTDRVAMQRLKEASEQAKIRLSQETSTHIKLPFIAADASGPKHLDVELSRSKFQELTHDLVEKTVEPALTALEDAGMSKSEIDKVLLVGGSTRMPAIQDKVRSLFGIEPSKEIDPDKVVALGAAVQGAVLSGEVKDMVLLDVTSLSLGIETVGGVFTKLIERNTQIPVAKTRVFTTAADGQTVVEVHVLQGERELAAHNKSLGRFELRNIPPAPRGVPQIEVTFDIDVNGIVNVSAKDLATNNKQKIVIQSPTNLTQEEINAMVKDAAIYAEEDAKRRTESQARNKANIELDTAERQLRELGEQMSFEQQKRLRDSIERLRGSLQTYDTEKIKEDTKVLQDAMYAVSTEAYMSVGGEKAQEAARKAGYTPTVTSGATAGGEAGAEGGGAEEPSDQDLFGWFQQ
ncbi:MAG: molecular chaperone DnaK [Candidatus Eremiobacteraeota bacterium]|nr:molecular chaperone DnaK [Candidatus Eremiobacteraeota bacterium]